MTIFELGPAILFVPADRPERYAKAYERSDAVIIDLEDAVSPADRPAARDALRDHLATLDSSTATRTVVRVNPVDEADFTEDVAALSGTDLRYVMVPKVEDPDDIATVAAALPGVGVVALCETAAGVLGAQQIAKHEAVVALMWGSEDLMASTGGSSSRFPDGTYRDVPRFARANVLLAAAAAGKGSIDTIHTDLSPTDQFIHEAHDAVASGWTAKACIHPAQVPIIRQAYTPTEEESEYAQALLAEVPKHGGVFQFRGTMVDGPLIAHARTVVTRAAKLADGPR
ncbi:CoA ester lyase [Enteractinococcus fodinae]|uniref:Citrate lyase subunit beta/citryl-CoA lyase n=1 Tax=Enteractinococcus fodinae TaxID=684663 RepID=A0ABU2B1A3_9MICC|nr:CoA ester lyase [Enteractinococcus fodinae]MDR7347387.1 citrate lyase subunit beta/citryl-CoA lyase [Enteractinococcus fodinae]